MISISPGEKILLTSGKQLKVISRTGNNKNCQFFILKKLSQKVKKQVSNLTDMLDDGVCEGSKWSALTKRENSLKVTEEQNYIL